MNIRRIKIGVYHDYPYRYAPMNNVLAVDSRKWVWHAFEPDMADYFGCFGTRREMERAIDGETEKR